MAASPLHASIVALARNLQIGSIMPQFHVVVDDFFETVHSHGLNPPPNWEELIVFSSFRADIDKDGAIPELADKWLIPEELYQR
jgi:hypothetical protein